MVMDDLRRLDGHKLAFSATTQQLQDAELTDTIARRTANVVICISA
jgi:hypothetical protein